MSETEKTKPEAPLDDWIRRMVEEDIGSAIHEHLDEMAYCASQVNMYQEAASSFQEEWHRAEHPADCRYCRCNARVAFRRSDPGFWILKDRRDETKPLWWRQAIDDYLETAPHLVRFAAGVENTLGGAVISMHPETLLARPIERLAMKGPLPMEGSNFDGQYPRQRLRSIMGEGDLLAVLWMVVSKQKRPNGEPEEGGFVIEVSDLSWGPARTIQTGLAGRRTLIVPVELAADYQGLVRGEVTVTFAQVAQVLAPGSVELQLLPPVELLDKNAPGNSAPGA